VIYVALGEVGAGNARSYRSTDTLSSTGGDDSIKLGDGDNIVIGGMGSDTIVVGNGTQTIIGDNGVAELDAQGLNLARVASSEPGLGGNDTVSTGNGAVTAILGYGSDVIGTGVGRHAVLGDNGEAIYVALGQLGAGNSLAYRSTDTQAGTGGDDRILLGDGDNVVIGGMGADFIAVGNGTQTIIGDNGVVEMDAQGLNLAFVASSEPTLGGDDTIIAGDGDTVIIGGIGNDEIRVGTGKHLIFGDNGAIFFAAKRVLDAMTTQAAHGGNDVIEVVGGDAVVFAGLGNDRVTTGGGNDILVGDNGWATWDSSGRRALVESSDPLLGGNDFLSSGAGEDELIGGGGDDLLYGDAGNDQLVGDHGRLKYADGNLVLVESIDPLIGGVDRLEGGGGLNTLIGGDAGDMLVGTLDNSVMIGDSGSVAFDGAGHVTSVTRYGTSAMDLVAQLQEQMYSARTPGSPAFFAQQSIRAQANAGNGAEPSPAWSRSADDRNWRHSSSFGDSLTANSSSLPASDWMYGREPSAAGVDDSEDIQDTTVPNGEPANGLRPDAQPEGGFVPPEGELPPVEGAPATSEGGLVPPEGELPPAEGAPAALSGPGENVSAGLEDAVEQGSIDMVDTLVLAGLLGAPSWYGASSSSTTGRKGVTPGSDARRPDGQARWLAAPSGDAVMLLDRRARPRHVAGQRRIGEGAVETIATRWLDGAQGMQDSFDSINQLDSAAARPRIDWGRLSPK
jgi:Ca2+-binding RTX toxin-like protein